MKNKTLIRLLFCIISFALITAAFVFLTLVKPQYDDDSFYDILFIIFIFGGAPSSWLFLSRFFKGISINKIISVTFLASFFGPIGFPLELVLCIKDLKRGYRKQKEDTYELEEAKDNLMLDLTVVFACGIVFFVLIMVYNEDFSMLKSLDGLISAPYLIAISSLPAGAFFFGWRAVSNFIVATGILGFLLKIVLSWFVGIVWLPVTIIKDLFNILVAYIDSRHESLDEEYKDDKDSENII
ncbi:MAG: hypothetical protein ACI4QZ_05885 [Eubacteriales bacterium]